MQCLLLTLFIFTLTQITSYKGASQLLDILPAHLVPKDYGGEASSLNQLNGMFWNSKTFIAD